MGRQVRYDEAQLARLAALSLVPWVRRGAAVAGPETSAPSSAPSSAQVPPAAIPREPSVLAGWLPDQPLATPPRSGSEGAPLLVLLEPAAGAAGEAPLAGEAARLFERMLGAIGLGPADACLCTLALWPAPNAPTVAAVAGGARRATLALVRELDDALDAEGCRLRTEALGAAWCLAHPERLLEAPLGKRQAWAVLKALGRHLGTRP